MSLCDAIKYTQLIGPPDVMQPLYRERLWWGGVSRLEILLVAQLLRNVSMTIAITEIFTPFKLMQLSLQPGIRIVKMDEEVSDRR